MIHLTNVNLIYGERYVLDDISLSIKDQDKIGLIGRNGAGKSSLFRIIAGLNKPTSGNVVIEGGAEIGILRQDIELPSGMSPKEACMDVMADLNELNNEYIRLEKDIATRSDYESDDYMKILDRFSHLAEKIAMINPDKIEAEIERILKGLGFNERSLHQSLETLSGGWRMRVELAKILVRKPEFILLDEPNNHLDIYSIIWLEKFIKDYTGSVIIISHDSTFLNNTANKILEIDRGKVEQYDCNYDKYMVEKVDRQEKLKSAFQNQQKVIAEKQKTINRFIAKATKTKMAQSMQKQLDKMDRIEYEEFNSKKFNLHISYSKRSALEVFHLKGVGKDYGALHVLNDVEFKILREEKVAFIGQNGQGKSTLVKLMMGIEELTRGQIIEGVNCEIGYYAQNQEESLDPSITVLETLESVIPEDKRSRTRSILGSFLFSGEDVDKKVSVLSGGERARLAMACMFCRPLNVIILDEPTNHLDIPSKEVLKNAVQAFPGTVILVSHDRHFMKGWLEKIFSFRNGKVQEYIGGLEDYLMDEGLQDMREVEQSEKTVNHASKTQQKPELSHGDKKKLKNKLNQVERQISEVEKEKRNIEEKLLDPDVFKTPEGPKLSSLHQEMEKKIKDLESTWEELIVELE